MEFEVPSRRERWLFLTTASLILAAVVLGVAREQHWGEPSVSLELRTPSATRLTPGMDVRISGIAVGEVRSLAMQPDASVRVKLRIDEAHQKLIGPGSQASQGQDSLLGDPFVQITPDPRPAGVALPQQVPYAQPVEVGSLLARFAETQHQLNTTLANTATLTRKDLPSTLHKLRDTLSQTGASANKFAALASTLDRETDRTAPELRRSLRQVDRTGEAATSLVEDTRPLLVETLGELNAISRTTRELLQQFTGLLLPLSPAESTKTKKNPVEPAAAAEASRTPGRTDSP